MSNRMHALAQGLTGKTTLDDCSIEEVQHIAQRHPYFAPAQFLLLQKLRQAGKAEEAEAQYRKAVLYFHDPLLFEHFISSNKFYVDEIATAPIAEPELAAPLTFKTDAIEVTENVGRLQEDNEEKVVEGSATVDIHIGAPIELHQQAIEMVSAKEPGLDLNTEEDSQEPQIEPSNSEEQNDNQLKSEETETTVPVLKISNTATPTTDIAFEPFHTVDYFASQGIKISQEELPKDKLGKQLKSFTEWLKTMKRLPASQLTETVETSAEKKVESMASHSVSDSKVVTEAMAEVWLKQGNTKKALEIYNKLSLLNPSKKAYFAAKIENLKLS